MGTLRGELEGAGLEGSAGWRDTDRSLISEHTMKAEMMIIFNHQRIIQIHKYQSINQNEPSMGYRWLP